MPEDDFVRHQTNYQDVFLGESSFYLFWEFVLSFSSRSYPSVRKRTEHFRLIPGMSTSTNTVFQIQTECYSFGPLCQECSGVWFLLEGWEWGAWQTPSSGQTPNCVKLLRWQFLFFLCSSIVLGSLLLLSDAGQRRNLESWLGGY